MAQLGARRSHIYVWPLKPPHPKIANLQEGGFDFDSLHGEGFKR